MLATELERAWQAAAGWLVRSLDRGDGLVRHGPRRYPGGLSQQGWRDALHPDQNSDGGGILRSDGSEPMPPLADADSQAVAVAALRALAVLDQARAAYWSKRASVLRARVTGTFPPDVMALEAGDVAVSGSGSQLGWLLWAGSLDEPAATAAAERLMEPDLLTPFGLRTLSSDSPMFTPHGYHRGAIWPFDSWLGWGGLRAHGYADAAERIRTGVLTALSRLGRSPELYAVSEGGELQPVAIANRVQAWTVGAAWAFGASWDGRVT